MHVLNIFGVDESGNRVAGSDCVVGPATLPALEEWAKENGFERKGAVVWQRESECFLHKKESGFRSAINTTMWAKADRVYDLSEVTVSEQ